MARSRTLGEQTRLFVVSTGALALIGALIILASEYSAASQGAEQILENARDLTGARLSQSVADTRGRLQGLADVDALPILNSDRCQAYVDGALPALPEFTRLFVTGADGTLLCQSPTRDSAPRANAVADLSTAPWWRGASHPDTVFFSSQPVFDQGTDDWQLIHTIPLTTPGGERVAYLGVSQPVLSLVELFQTDPLPDEHIVTVGAHDGHVIARSQDLEGFLLRNVTLPQLTAQAELFKSSTGFNEAPTLDGTPTLWAYLHLTEAPWTVYTGVPQAWVTRRALASAWPKLILIGLLFAAPVVFGSRVLQSIARSIKSVVRWSEDRDGAGSSPPPHVETEEVRQLASTFERTLDERNAANAAEHAALGRIQSILNNAVFGIYISDADGRFLDSNPAMARMLGYESEAELATVEISSLYSDPAQREEVLADAYSGRRTSAEVEWLRRDGSRFPVRLNWRRLEDAESGGVFEVIAEDVSDRKELETQLRQSQKLEAIGRLAGGVAHDFNNRLTVISGQAEMLLEDLPEDHPYAEYARLILESSERSAELTAQLLAFSRRQLQRTQVVDLNSTLKTVKGMAERLIGEDIDVGARMTEDATVMADAGQMEQVLMNLCTNARDAMPDGGRLLLSTEHRELSEEEARTAVDAAPGHYVVLSVSDTGEGMDEETQSRIFEPFFTTKPAGKGTGLGLSTVYGIVSQSGGHLKVFSWPGRGTRFEIWLPKAVGEVTEEPADRPWTPGPVGNGETILVAEDEAPVRQVIVATLERAGYRVLAAEDGYHALSLAADHDGPIDLLVSDVLMPGMKGPDLAERLLQLGTIGRVIFVSGYAEESPEIEHVGLPWDFMAKPFAGAALGAKVRALLDQEAYVPVDERSPAGS